MAEQAVQGRVLPVERQVAALGVPGQPAPPLQVPAGTAGDGPENLLQLGPGRWRYPPELQPVMVPEVDAIQYQQVEVDVQVQRAAEALDQPLRSASMASASRGARMRMFWKMGFGPGSLVPLAWD